MFLTAKEVKEKYKITNQTLYNWRKGNKIRWKILPSGSFLYYDLDSNPLDRKHVIYGRVSNTKQKDDLIHQMSILRNFVATNGNIIDEEYSDVASGMNENRRGFNKLVESVVRGEIDTIYITYKDRLTRFGYGYIEKFFSQYKTRIVVLNSTSEEDFQTELTEDLISIIHHFSMKMYSNRRKKLKEIKEVLENSEVSETENS